jgi:hypothetical protein
MKLFNRKDLKPSWCTRLARKAAQAARQRLRGHYRAARKREDKKRIEMEKL